LALKLNRYALYELEEYPVIEEILGAGAMGVVFLCRNKLGKRRVIKSFWDSIEGSEDEVFYEARVMNEIAGEYIPEPLTFGYLDKAKKEKAYLVTEYIARVMDAETWLRKKGCLRLNEGLKVGLQIAKGLELAHQKGILHLDLKPSNLLLSENDLKVKIIDFGLSRFVKNVNNETHSEMTVLRRDAVYGTRDYGCPEQLGRNRLLTNRPAGENMNPNYLPVPALYDLLMNCVNFVPDERPASATVLVEGLEKIQKSETQSIFGSFLSKILGKNSPRPASPTPTKQISPTTPDISRSHAERGNALEDALRPAPQSGANMHSHALRGNEERADIYTNSIGMKFKLIKAGKFQMGSEKGSDREKPVHWVEDNQGFLYGDLSGDSGAI